MNLVEIKKLIEIFNHNTEIARLSLKQDNFELKLDKNPSQNGSNTTQIATPPAQSPQTPSQIPSQQPQSPQDSTNQPNQQTPAPNTNGEYITSPMVGTFYHRPSPDAAPYVNVGDKIKKGQTIGIIEAMKIMNEIEAEFDCKIISIEAGDAQPVEYGSNLIKVEKL